MTQLNGVDLVATHAALEPRFVPVSEEELTLAGLADTCAPYWGRWCSRPDPTRAFEVLGFRTRELAEYLPDVVQAHLANPALESHQGYAHRERERELAARLGVH